MKNIFLLLFCLCFVAGCSKDENNDNEKLAGTCWDRQEESVSAYKYRRICFGINRVSYSYEETNGTYDAYELSYTYNEPKIEITDNTNGLKFAIGYIEGDILYIMDAVISTHEGMYIMQ